GDVNLGRYVGNGPTINVDPTGLSPKGKAVGWVVKLVGKKYIKVATYLTEKDAARIFVGRLAAKETANLIVRDGCKDTALKIARIVQNKLGKDATGKILVHKGHNIKNLLGDVIGKGARHIQFDKLSGSHI